MLKTIDALDKGFQATVKRTNKECSNELEELRKFIFGMKIFTNEVMNGFKENRIHRRKWGNSLLTWCFLESFRSFGHLLFLTYNGLYRNTFYNIRYLFESTVQARYLDSRLQQMENISFLEPDKHIDNIFVKLTILREVEDKREYHVSNLINKLKIGKAKAKRLRKFVYDIFIFLCITYFSEVKDSLKKNSEFVDYVKTYKLYLTSKMLDIRLGEIVS